MPLPVACSTTLLECTVMRPVTGKYLSVFAEIPEPGGICGET